MSQAKFPGRDTNSSSRTNQNSIKKPENSKGTDNNTIPTTTDVQDLSELIKDRITQLQSATDAGDEEEKIIAKAVKKANRDLNQVLNSEQSQDKKLNILQKKYMEMFSDIKRLLREHTKLKRRQEQITKEKESLKSEVNKLTYAKQKLENLCRDLLKENKQIKEETEEYFEKDQSLGENNFFEEIIYDIEEKLDEIKEEEFPEKYKKRFKLLCRQYHLREKHFRSILKARDLELRLLQAKYDQQKQTAEQESFKVSSLKQQMNSLLHIEGEMKKFIDYSVDKIHEIESTSSSLDNETFVKKGAQGKKSNKNKQKSKQTSKKHHKQKDSINNQLDQLLDMCTQLYKLYLPLTFDNSSTTIQNYELIRDFGEISTSESEIE